MDLGNIHSLLGKNGQFIYSDSTASLVCFQWLEGHGWEPHCCLGTCHSHVCQTSASGRQSDRSLEEEKELINMCTPAKGRWRVKPGGNQAELWNYKSNAMKLPHKVQLWCFLDTENKIHFCNRNYFFNNCFSSFEVRVSKWTEFTDLHAMNEKLCAHPFLLKVLKAPRTVVTCLLMYPQTGLKEPFQISLPDRTARANSSCWAHPSRLSPKQC